MSKIATYGLADSPLQLSDRLIGTEAPRPEPSATPLATKNFSLGELLQLFSSNFPAANLQAVLDSGNTASQDISLIGTIFVSNIEPGEIIDATGSEGLPMQFLSKASSGVNWVDLPIKYPTLDEVLNEGNTSDLIAKVGGLSLLNNPGIGYLSLYGNNNSLNIYNSSNKLISSIYRDVILFNDFDSEYYFKIQKPSLLSSNHTAFLQDTSGTIAYLQDIPEQFTLTTFGDSGPATFEDNVLNIPQYSGGSSSIPTLNQVLTEGNVSQLNASFGGVDLFDKSNEYYYNISVNDDTFKFINNDGDNVALLGLAEFSIYKTSSIIANLSASLLTDTRNYQLPNTSGIIALTSDIPSLSGYVPYTGATQNVDLGEYELKAGQIQFDQTPTGASGVGIMRWNNTDGTVDLGLKGGNVTLQLGQENVVLVANKTGIDLLESNYQVVRTRLVSEGGASGQRMAVVLAQANNDANSATTLGVVTENINNNQQGFITVFGNVREINTTGSLQGETWVDGDILYLSPTIPGQLTNIKPSAPEHLIIVGTVEYAHSQHGKIFVKVDNGYELDELHNVNIDSPANNELLAYNSSNQLWENKTLSEVNAQQFFMNLPYRYINTAQSIGSNAAGETQLIKVTIPANTFSSNDKFYFRLGFSKAGVVNAAIIRVKLTTASSMPSGTTSQIATVSIGNTSLYAPVERNMAINGGNLKGFAFTIASLSDSTASVNAWSSVAFDVTQTQYFYVSNTPASSTTDVTYLEYVEITNI